MFAQLAFELKDMHCSVKVRNLQIKKATKVKNNLLRNWAQHQQQFPKQLSGPISAQDFPEALVGAIPNSRIHTSAFGNDFHKLLQWYASHKMSNLFSKCFALKILCCSCHE